MSVLVKGMEKPEHCGYCRFRYGGICHALQKTQYSMDECPLAGIDDVPDICVGDTISRQEAIDAFYHIKCNLQMMDDTHTADKMMHGLYLAENAVKLLPSAQPTLYGYNIEHLELIARVLQKEDLPPERVADALKDIGKSIV